MRRVSVVVVALLTTGLTLLPMTAATAEAATARHRLENVVVPGYCQMPAQRLHDGRTASGYLPKEGRIQYGDPKPMLVHLGHRGTQLLAGYECTAGGVWWPEVLVLYNRHNKLIGSLELARYSPAEHSQVTSWHPYRHTAKLAWESYEGAGFHFTHHHSTLTFAHGKLRLG